jgi:hypothetical protein
MQSVPHRIGIKPRNILLSIIGFMCVFCRLFFVLFALLRFTDFDEPYGIFKFLLIWQKRMRTKSKKLWKVQDRKIWNTCWYHRYCDLSPLPVLVCIYLKLHNVNKIIVIYFGHTVYTVVKELRSKMFRQHPGYFKAVFLKKTQIIIVSIYEYIVYIMFWIMMLYDCYYY